MVFPDLFKDASMMPADLRRYLRYPEALLKSLVEVYGLYHMKLRVGGLRVDPVP